MVLQFAHLSSACNRTWEQVDSEGEGKPKKTGKDLRPFPVVRGESYLSNLSLLATSPRQLELYGQFL
jgi:hypothetical protein